MLAVHPAARDAHHAYARNNGSGDEGPLYQSLAEASDANVGSNCYILSSSVDPTWLVVSGKRPSSIGEADLAEWFRDVRVRGRIDKDKV